MSTCRPGYFKVTRSLSTRDRSCRASGRPPRRQGDEDRSDHAKHTADCRSANGAEHSRSREAAQNHQEAEAAREQRPALLSVRFGVHAVALLFIDSPIVWVRF
jgi:hypothetical protein